MPAANDLVEQLTLRATPRGDPLTQPTVQRPEVRLDLSEVGEEPASRRDELLVPIPLRRPVQYLDLTGAHLGDLGVDRVPAHLQLGQAGVRVGLRAVGHLTQQL